MSHEDRQTLINAYFTAMDTEDLGHLEDALATTFVYDSLGGPLEGFSGLETYMTELRGLSNTTHEIAQTVHGETASAVEGTVSGDSGDGSVSARFCNVFEFDDTDDAIARIAVYLNDA